MADVVKGVGGGDNNVQNSPTEVVAPSTSAAAATAANTSKSSIKITSKRTNGSSNGVKAAAATNDEGAAVASEFKARLDALLDTKPSISKEKMNQIVREAVKCAKHYKHVVYYVESFIKKCPREFKISGLYILDAIARNTKSSSSSPSNNKKNGDKKAAAAKSSTAKIKDLYNKRFAINICKTFTHLFSKANKIEREKINKVLKLWQKYKVFDVETMDKLFRISSTSKIDSVINSANNSGEALDELTNTKAAVPAAKAEKTGGGEMKRRKTDISEVSADGDQPLYKSINNNSASVVTTPIRNDHNDRSPSSDTHNEISKILAFENDLDSDSDQEGEALKRRGGDKQSKHSSNSKSATTKPSSRQSPSADAASSESRYKTSLNNCAAWLESNVVTPSNANAAGAGANRPSTATSTPASASKINLPDLSQPPPPILKSSNPAHVPPPPSTTSNSSAAAVTAFLNSRFQQAKSADNAATLSREKEKERLKRGLSKIRPDHICICSKTIWLGHLSKTTTEEMLVNEITNIIEHSSSSSSSSKRSKSSSSKNIESRKVVVDVNLIPPRGCAFVELLDRKMAAKCIDRMKEGYRLDASHIKVAWATNKGINQDRRIKQHWNVEIGCTYIPWSDLESYSRENLDFLKWVEGGILDEDSLPEAYRLLYTKHLESAKEAAKSDAANKSMANTTANTSHIVHDDMELDEDDDLDERGGNKSSHHHHHHHNHPLNVSVTGLRQQGPGPITPPIPPPPPPAHQSVMMVPPPPGPNNNNAAANNGAAPNLPPHHHHMVGLVPPPPQDVGQQGGLSSMQFNSIQVGNFRLNAGPLPTILNAAQHATALQQFNLAAAVNAARQQQQSSSSSTLNGSGPNPPLFAPLYHHPSLAAAQFLQQPRAGAGGPPPPPPPPPPPYPPQSDLSSAGDHPNKDKNGGGFFLIVNKQQQSASGGPGGPQNQGNPGNQPQPPPHQTYSNMQFIQAAQFPIFHHQALLNNGGSLGNQLRFLDQQAAVAAQQASLQAAAAAAAAASAGGLLQVDMVPPPPNQQQQQQQQQQPQMPKPLMSLDAGELSMKKT